MYRIYPKKYAFLTGTLLAYLKALGYTHILKEGPNEEAQEYYLRALKKGNPKRRFVEDINEDEFVEMAAGIPLMDFYIVIPGYPVLKS